MPFVLYVVKTSGETRMISFTRMLRSAQTVDGPVETVHLHNKTDEYILFPHA